MTMEEYQEYLEENGLSSQPKKPSMIKRMMKGIGGEIMDGHRAIKRKRERIAAQNKNIKAKRKAKYPNRDYSIVRAHERCKIGW